VAHFAHLGGMLGGFLMIRYWRKQAPFGSPLNAARGAHAGPATNPAPASARPSDHAAWRVL
jgi:hypothetical protein